MDSLAQESLNRAATLAIAARELQGRRERAEAGQMARMMVDAAGKAFTLAMADRVFRSHAPRRQAARVRSLVARLGIPRYLPAHQRWMLRGGTFMAGLMPGVVMGCMESQLRRSSRRVILDAAPAALAGYLTRRRDAGTRVNLNSLGEAILGEAEAGRRLQAIVGHLGDPLVDYVSVKISAIYSQISVIDFERTLAVIMERLRVPYRAARPAAKFVNLDMEEYRDLALTMAAFQQVLDEPEFLTLSAGIVLQAYLPDSWAAQQQLTEWARRRVAAGGAPVKLRLVKGANLAMERVEAELHGWRAAPYDRKADTDANYRRMLEHGCRPENAAVVRLGVATHNLFDVALALALRDANGVADRVEIEMLEGMANDQARAVQAAAGGLLVYAPSVGRSDFLSALAYLVRRLDENTSPENFLHDVFDCRPGTPAWARQQGRLLDGWTQRGAAPIASRRATLPPSPSGDEFHNASDTDWTRADRRAALADALDAWRPPPPPPALPALDDVLTTAVAAQSAWAARGSAGRASILRDAADAIERARLATIAQIVREGRKAAAEADVEVSEAVDFARYAAATAAPAAGVVAAPLGVVVIAPPWNFPYAIPCGGVTAALAAGNAVILKPAPETVGIAGLLASHLWAAGVPRDVLHFFPCPDGDVGRALVADPRVAAVVLTGAYETARLFLSWRPTLKLFAETSGKNAIVVTADADRDLAIRDLVRSAFGHSGQKCSSASLAILEAEVYEDPAFRRALRDAAASLRVGPATDLGNVVTPLICEPSPNLKRALTTLEAGEEWLLAPNVDAGDPCLWSPGIKLGVRPGGWFHQTECFGPVLGLIRADDLSDAIRIQNATPFGLTGGLQLLDETEVERWIHEVEVGNAYVNRPITGAVVRRQPFGGWKRSSIGPGAKACGPDYVSIFSTLADAPNAAEDYRAAHESVFAREHDPSGLSCESNVLRYRPRRGVLARVGRADAESLARLRAASAVCNVPLRLSFIEDETEFELAARLPALVADVDLLRTLAPPGDALLSAAHDAGLNWIDGAPLRSGRGELPRWLREQSLSRTRHRYGLIDRPGDPVGPVGPVESVGPVANA